MVSLLELAVADKINQGVYTKDWTAKNTPHFTFVDYNHMADTRERIQQAMAASVEAIYLVFGNDPPKGRHGDQH